MLVRSGLNQNAKPRPERIRAAAAEHDDVARRFAPQMAVGEETG